MKREHVILALILISAFALRLYGVLVDVQRFFREPTYGMAAWRIVEGDIPYRDFYHAQPPLSPYLLAFVFFLFGVGVTQARLFMVFFTTFTCFMIYLNGKRIDIKTGLLGSLIYAIAPLSILYGMMAVNDFIAITFVIIGYYFLTPIIIEKKNETSNINTKRNYLILAGFFLSLGVMVKTIVVPIFIAFIVIIIIEGKLAKAEMKEQIENTLYLFIGLVIPIILVFSLFYLIAGEEFTDQVLEQHFEKGSVPWEERWSKPVNYLIRDNFYFFVFFLFSAPFAARNPYGRGLIIAILFMIFSILLFVPRQYGNYYEATIPLMAMVSGFFPLPDIKKIKFKRKNFFNQETAKIVLAASLIVLIAITNVSYPRLSETDREAIDWVKENTSPEDYVISDNLIINFWAERRSPFAEVSKDRTHLGELTGKMFIEACYEYDVKVVVKTGRLFGEYETYNIFLAFLNENYNTTQAGYIIYFRTSQLP
ncbi:MAG: ArnT family glycosyltransferase [Candidatus Wukongarchaeota archaeon]|nr:glycosyltransferase family 39 protein [Candidatus Wukongarchaeota archaeon]